MKKSQPNRTWIEIDTKAIEMNVKTLKSALTERTRMMAVVKSNAYGHGMVISAKAALAAGAEWLGVDEITEALELRKARIKAPILVLGYTLPGYFKEATQKNVSLSITSLEALQNLSKMRLSKKVRIHLKFETGLNRQGIPPTHIQQTIRLITAKNFPGIVEGAYTHFAVMEDPLREDYSKRQAFALREAVAKLHEKGLRPIVHASPSAGALFKKDFNFDMCRAGIAMYGQWPSSEIRLWAKGTELVPVFTWKTIVTEVKFVERGSKVGYDLTYETSRDSRLAIIPVGYWHGLPRALSSKGEVLVHGKRAPIVGRISMDITIIDVTHIPKVAPGDEVVIIGKQGTDSISANEVAEKAGTINYEILTRVNPQISRIAVK
jgi:alanine racemase